MATLRSPNVSWTRWICATIECVSGVGMLQPLRADVGCDSDPLGSGSYDTRLTSASDRMGSALTFCMAGVLTATPTLNCAYPNFEAKVSRDRTTASFRSGVDGVPWSESENSRTSATKARNRAESRSYALRVVVGRPCNKSRSSSASESACWRATARGWTSARATDGHSVAESSNEREPGVSRVRIRSSSTEFLIVLPRSIRCRLNNSSRLEIAGASSSPLARSIVGSGSLRQSPGVPRSHGQPWTLIVPP